MTPQRQMLQAFSEQETKYHIEVIDNSMLPKNLKDRKEISFTLKPPTTFTLTQAAEHISEIPEELFEKSVLNFREAAPYSRQMVKVLCTISWAMDKPYPDWYEEFILKNTTPKELYFMFAETTHKMKTDFFLTSFRLADQNPLLMRRPKTVEGLIRTNS